MEKQRIHLETAFNARDLSGYKSRNMELTSDRFIRSDCFIPMSKKDRDTLTSLGVKTVIDLRDSFEKKRLPSVFANSGDVDYVNLPVFGKDQVPDEQSNDAILRFVMGDFYISVVDRNQAPILGILKKMASVSEGKIMFHCSAGKDRTGIISALLLSIAGVENETIVNDYTLTETFLSGRMDELRKGAGIKEDVPDKFAEELLGAKASSMEKLLAHFGQKYGGIVPYLEKIGLSGEEMARLKSMMIRS